MPHKFEIQYPDPDIEQHETDKSSQKKFEIQEPQATDKKFEIQKIKQPKKFEIQRIFTTDGSTSQSTPDRLATHNMFRITSEGHEQQVEWFQQTDSINCGPCMLLNISRQVDTDYHPSSITEVRELANHYRESRPDMTRLEDGMMLSTNDIYNILHKKMDYDVDGFFCDPVGREETIASINSELESGFDFVYFTQGTHFRAIMHLENTTDEYLLLDSLSDGPQTINQQQLNNLIATSFTIRSTGHYEEINIARKKI